MPKTTKVKKKVTKTKAKVSKPKTKVAAKPKAAAKAPIKFQKLMFLKKLKNICVKNIWYFLE
jgi:DnaK suppressor protein